MAWGWLRFAAIVLGGAMVLGAALGMLAGLLLDVAGQPDCDIALAVVCPRPP
jgi:hypothetical protein